MDCSIRLVTHHGIELEKPDSAELSLAEGVLEMHPLAEGVLEMASVRLNPVRRTAREGRGQLCYWGVLR